MKKIVIALTLVLGITLLSGFTIKPMIDPPTAKANTHFVSPMIDPPTA